MDKYTVKLLSRALQDLDRIYCYIARELLQAGTAEAIIDELETGILSLAQMPHRCPERRTGFYANKGYRQMLIKNYTVVYRVDDDRKQVTVVTVRYAKSSF